MREYVKEQFVNAGMCADFAIHDTGGGNPHAHIMLTMRPIEQGGAWGAKQKKEYILDKDGGKIYDPKKRQYKCKSIPATDWNEQTKAEEWRAAWAEICNRALEQNGHAERIDRRSYARQGIDQIPTVHLGVAASAMEKRGIRTERGNLNREIEVTNQRLRQLKARISKLQNWLKEETENTAPPTLADYIQDILRRKAQAGKAQYSQSLYNLKDAANMLNFLTAIDNLMAGLGNADADIEMLIGNVVEAFQNVVKNITPVIENIVKALPAALDGILQAIGDLLPTLLSTVVDLFTQVLETLLKLLPELIPAVVQAVLTIVDALVANLPLLVEAAIQIIVALVTGIGEALPELIPAIVEAIILIVQTLLDNMDKILEAAFAIIKGLAEGLLNALPELVAALPEIITTIINFITDNLPAIIQMGIELIVQLAVGLVKAIPQLVAALPQIIAAIVQGLGQAVGAVFEIGKNIVSGLWQGIQSLASWLWDKVSGWISSIWDGICDFFGIASPSKEMGWVGKMMVEGLAGSIDSNGKDAVNAVTDMAKDIDGAMKGIADDMQTALPTDFNMDIDSDINRIANDSVLDVKKTVEHTGIIRVEGVNDEGTLTGVVDIVIDRLRQEVRV